MAEIKFACSFCTQHIVCDDSMVGVQINCPTCKARITIARQQLMPSLPTAAVSAPASIGPKVSPPLPSPSQKPASAAISSPPKPADVPLPAEQKGASSVALVSARQEPPKPILPPALTPPKTETPAGKTAP